YAAFADSPWQPSSIRGAAGMKLVDQVNVAQLASEEAHHYRWWDSDVIQPGFPSEVYELSYVDCQPRPENLTCRVLDGGRLISGGEEMTIATQPGQDLLWIMRVHPVNRAQLAIFVDDKQIGTRVIPPSPGWWLEIATL